MMQYRLKVGVLSALVTGFVSASSAVAAVGGNEHKLDFAARVVQFDVDSHGSTNTGTEGARSAYSQRALGLQLNYASPLWWNTVAIGASLYGVSQIDTSGLSKNTTQLLRVGSNGQLEDGYLTLGQAYVSLTHGDLVSAKLGRQLQSSLLLKSTSTRAVPDTYSGASAQFNPMAGLSIYGAVYDKWRPRTASDFEKLKTDLASSATVRSKAGDIDYVSVLGAAYKTGPWAVNFEYLNSRNYLDKTGLVAAYTIPLKDKDQLILSSGLFTSRDAGNLFVCGAESEVDCGGVAQGTRIHNNGRGIYIDANWKVSNFTLGAALAKFNGLWIEDNFSVNSATPGVNGSAAYITDHGTNPFPTSAAMGPDLSSNGESVRSVRLGYDWKDYVPGLTTAYKYAKGTGARNSANETLGAGSEKYYEIDAKYAIPLVKGLGFRYIFMKYQTEKTGALNSITKNFDETDHRIYLDYNYKF